MKFASDLYKKSKSVEFYKNQFDLEEDKKNILFVEPVLTSFDLYSMIVPYMSMESTEKIKTAITGMFRFSEIDSKPPTKISESEIKWANFIVVPLSLENFSGRGEFFDQIREINPEVKIITPVEFDFYNLPNDHYLLSDHEVESILERQEKSKSRANLKKCREQLKAKIIGRLESNVKSADRLIVMNQNLKLSLREAGYSDVKFLPVMLDEKSFKENIDFMDTLGIKGTPNVVFMSVDLSESTWSSFYSYLKYFKEIKKKHGKKFRIVIIGDSPLKYMKNFDLEYDHLGKASIIHHYKNIVKSSADFHLLLNKNTKYFKNSENLISFVDRGLFGIPLATINANPISEIIEADKTGFILDSKKQIIDLVDQLMKDKKNLLEVSNNLVKIVKNNCQIDDNKLTTLLNIFTKDYTTNEEEE